MQNPATEIARRLADHAESVCRHFLSKGHREGRYWLVGDVRNTPGRSLYVRLAASADGRGAAGKWTDAATGDHGDLLDIIAIAKATRSMRETLDEARHFLSLPMPEPDPEPRWRRPRKTPAGTPEAASRLFAATAPIGGSVVEWYLRERAITDLRDCDALRFKSGCYYRPSKRDAPDTRPAWPAMIAAVTDLADRLTGVHRTWLDPVTRDKAPVAYPRRAMGDLLGHGVRFRAAGPFMVAGEGIETILSLRQVMPAMPAIAGLSGAHLAAILFPPALRRLYVARDDDPTGAGAHKTLAERALAAGIETVPLDPLLDDFNSDLRILGADRLRAHLLSQLVPEDATRFLLSG
jgi:hypothetical protein